MYKHNNNYITSGADSKTANGALIIIHGRGSSAQNIIGLANEFNASSLALYAPQANNHSWYPYSFMAPEAENEPALSSAIETIDQLVEQVIANGISAERIYFCGFSQGACLTLEYIARNARQYGGAIAFTGGLIGEVLKKDRYKGDFNQTPVLITTGDPDPHVPVGRVQESAALLQSLNANVTLQIYKGRQHTISMPEIKLANEIVFKAGN